MHKNYMKMNKFAIIIFTNTWLHFLSAEKFGQSHGYSLPEVGMFNRKWYSCWYHINHPWWVFCDGFQLNNTFRRGTFIAEAELRCSLNPSQKQIFTECEWQGNLMLMKEDFCLKAWMGSGCKLQITFFHLKIYYKSIIIYYTLKKIYYCFRECHLVAFSYQLCKAQKG